MMTRGQVEPLIGARRRAMVWTEISYAGLAKWYTVRFDEQDRPYIIVGGHFKRREYLVKTTPWAKGQSVYFNSLPIERIDASLCFPSAKESK